MKHEKLSDALEEIRDRYIAEAYQEKKKPFPWIPTVAAVLALVIATGFAGRLLPDLKKAP